MFQPKQVKEILGKECFDSICSDTWFNIAAQTYLEIDKRIQDDGCFVAAYINEIDEGDNNPNLELYIETVCSIEAKVRSTIDKESRVLDELASIKSKIENTELISFKDDVENACVFLFAIIAGINRAYAFSKHRSTSVNRGPLNDECREFIGIYYKPVHHFVESFYRAFDTRFNYPADGFNKILNAIFLFKRETGKNLPRIVASSPDPNFICEQRDSIKLCIAPLLGSNVDFTGRDSDLLTEHYFEGTLFGVKYSDDYRGRLEGSIAKILHQASIEGCHIVMFPEFIINDELIDVIRSQIKSLASGHNLQLVVAGSFWGASPCSNPDKRCMSNYGRLFNGCGEEIGHYYKTEPFIDEKHRERLDVPGQDITLVDIPGFGRVLPQICKDGVGQEERCSFLCKHFLPSLVCIPACSKSIEFGFEPSFRSLLTRYYAMPVLGNSCILRMFKSVEGDARKIGLIMLPTVMQKKVVEHNETKEKYKVGDPEIVPLNVACNGKECEGCSKAWIGEIKIDGTKVSGKSFRLCDCK